MFCTNCGNKLNENDKFCIICGKAVPLSNSDEQADTVNNDTTEVKENLTKFLRSGLIFSLVAFILCTVSPIVSLIVSSFGLVSAKKQNPQDGDKLISIVANSIVIGISILLIVSNIFSLISEIQITNQEI